MSHAPSSPRHGLLIVYTGEGKGKTTAALGQVLRAAGHGFRACVIQFIKGKWPTGEARAVRGLQPEVDFHVVGSGFTWQSDKEQTRQAAKEGWRLAKEAVLSGAYDMVVLDELTYLVTYGLVPESEIIDSLAGRPPAVHVVVTGRGASENLIAAADLVTEMRCVKHPYKKGIAAQKGVEF